MIAGNLEIDFATNLARLSSDMAQAKSAVTSATQNIESAVASAKSALGALGIGLSVGYFANLVKSSIDAADHLNDLSKSTNLSVETLAGLKIAAKQSGGDVDSIATSIQKLSVEMGKSPEKFRALGISAKDPFEAFKQLSDLFVGMGDTQQRNAVMAEVLGKAWAGAAPLLAEGSAKLEAMVVAGTKASGMTTEMARKADALNDSWVLLWGSGGMLNSVMAQMYDPLLRITNQMNAAKASSDSFLQSLYKFATTGGENDVIGRWMGLVDEAKETARRTGMGLGSGPSGARGVPSGSAADAADAAADAAKKAQAFLDAAAIIARAKKSAEDLARESADWALKSGARQFDEDMKNLEAKRAATKKAAEDALDLAKQVAEYNETAEKAQFEQMAKTRAEQDERTAGGKGTADSLRSVTELEALSYQERMSNLEFYLENSGLSVAAQNDLMQRAQQEHEATMGSISAQAALQRRKFAEQTAMSQASTMIGILTNLSAATAQKNRAAFEINKIAAMANAIMYTYEGANKALSMGPWGIPLAAVIVGLGLANVAQIAGTSFGSGAAPSAGGGGPGVTPVNQVPAIPNAGSQGSGQHTTIVLQGDTVGRKQLRALVEQLNENTKDGGRFTLA